MKISNILFSIGVGLSITLTSSVEAQLLGFGLLGLRSESKSDKKSKIGSKSESKSDKKSKSGTVVPITPPPIPPTTAPIQPTRAPTNPPTNGVRV